MITLHMYKILLLHSEEDQIAFVAITQSHVNSVVQSNEQENRKTKRKPTLNIVKCEMCITSRSGGSWHSISSVST